MVPSIELLKKIDVPPALLLQAGVVDTQVTEDLFCSCPNDIGKGRMSHMRRIIINLVKFIVPVPRALGKIGPGHREPFELF